MTRFRRTNRNEEARSPKTRRSSLRRTKAAEVVEAAGLARPEFETLEQRQLLFTMTITPELVNPFTGVGTATAFFGYVLPYIIPTSDPEQNEGETVVEDFNTDDPGAPGLNGFPVQSGTVFEGSGLRLEYGPLTSVRLTSSGGTAQDNFLRYTFQANDQFSFFFSSDQNPNINIAVESASMDITGAFNPNATVVELLLRGEVIATLTGAELNALGQPASGPVRNFTFTAPGTTPFNQVFDQVRFTAIAGAPSTTFDIDNVQYTTPGTFAANLVDERSRFGAQIVFTGPVGATLDIFDLYGRHMVPTLGLPIPEGSEVPLVDPNGDGVPDFNDGIGRIELRGTNDRSAVTIFGGLLVDMPAEDVDFADGSGFGFQLVGSLLGLYDDFEQVGFGYNVTVPPGGDPEVTGLPPGPGSVVIGSPWVRSLGNYNVGGAAAASPVQSGFTRADQGIKVMDGSAISSVYVHGIVFGSSSFSTIDKFVSGSQMGSISVAGDAGTIMVGSDAGMWMDDDGTPVISTQAELLVGRTLGEFVSAGRSLMHITVVGDLNSPTLRPARDVFRHYENEFVPDFRDPNLPPPPDTFTQRQYNRSIMLGNVGPSRDKAFAALTSIFFSRFTQALNFGNTNYRNDTLLSAEWVGSIASAVQIFGQVGRGGNPDPINTNEDGSDVFGFAVDGTQDIVVNLDASTNILTNNLLVRIVDADGRTVAAPALSESLRDFVVLRYRPQTPGVYYVVVQGDGNGTVVSDLDYNLSITGMAPTTFGAYRTGGGSGRNPQGDFGNGTNTVTVLSGSMGAIRVGTAFASGSGGDVDPSVVFNVPDTPVNANDDEIDEWLEFRDSAFSIGGNLYNITTGSDILGGGLLTQVVINVGGNFGSLLTGRSTLAGVNVREGDLRSFRMTTGGSIALVDVQGAVGWNQDVENPETSAAYDPAATVVFITGANPLLKGDIGVFRTGSYVYGPALSISTSNGSTIGALLVSQDLPFNPGNTFQGINGDPIDLNLGFNSDLRFFDTGFIDRANQRDYSVPLIAGAPALTFTDDSGSQFTIRIIGGNANAGGRIITHSGSLTSLGQLTGRIEVNLDGGARLQITSLGNANSGHITSIGRIVVIDSDAASSIGIDGTTQVDVWKIEQQGGDEFNEIVNITPFGDIVAIDMVALNRLELRTGDLGRTQMPAWSPKLIGPFIGVAVGDTTGDVGDPIPVPASALQDREFGLYRPVNNSNVNNVFLDDVGSPVDPYLNGLIVRTGDITLVQVGGAVGDVIAADGDIVEVFANFDRSTPSGRFDGIVGSIYANRISNVNIGDGLARPDPSPLSTTGIFANDDILSIIGDIAGSFISGRIVAADNVPGNSAPGAFPTDGIDRVELSGGGDYIDAYIASENLDAFWTAYFPADLSVYAGDINLVRGQDADFFRSTVSAFNVNTFRLTNGFFDASTLNAGGNLGTAEATAFRNSTVDGQTLEFRVSRITVGLNATLITTTNRAGDIADLTVDISGVLFEMSALNISRVSIDADIRIARLLTTKSFLASSVVTGRLVDMDVGDSLRSSSITVAGPLENLTAINEITNTDISVTGPDGRIDTISTRSRLTGRISSAGPIGTIEVTEGDMIATIVTVRNLRGIAGDIKLLRAGRDLDIITEIAGTVERFEAGRHLGSQFAQRVIYVSGDVQSISVPNGQLYSDIRIGGSLTEGASIGTAFNKPGASNLGNGSIIAFGRIEKIDINGDFGAKIYSYSGGIGVITINDGSLLPSAEVFAFDGTLQNIFINNGNLYGRVHADYNILAIRLNGSEDGIFGDIGVNPAFNPGAPYSQFRNQLPPNVIANVGVQGPRITAGYNIGRIILTNGSIFEAFIHAGRAIGTIDVTGNIQNDNQTSGIGTVIAAGSSIFTVRTAGNIENTMIIAGVRNFGADNALGGTGANADLIQSGRITTIHADGSMSNVDVAAGINAGNDGIYNTGDETVALGISFVREVTADGGANDVTVFADSPTLTVSPGVVRAGTGLPIADPFIASGVPGPTDVLIPTDGTPFNFTWNGVSGTISFTTDKGNAFWDASNGQITLVNTSLNSQLIVSAAGTLTNFDIVSNDDASMGLVQVDTNLAGDSKIVIDAYVLKIQTGAVSDTGLIRVGMNVREIVTGDFTGTIDAAFWARTITINGNFGTTTDFGEAVISMLAGDTVNIAGNNAGLISVVRDLSSLDVGGAMERAQFRVGNSVQSIDVGSALSESRISAGDNIGPVTIGGNMHASTIQAGGDLGEDVLPGGSGLNADVVSTGSIASVSIGGNFTRSSITAGVLRGGDGYFGTQDDEVAPGRSNIGAVTIAGSQVGSSLNTEQYRIAATGSVGTVTVAGQATSGQGNFQVRRLSTDVLPIRVVDLRTYPDAQTWYAEFYFNQSMDISTIGPALTISEIRGNTLIPLVQGVDYTIGQWNPTNNSVTIAFSREVTDRNLPQTPGVPGPGVFRFELDSDVLRATVESARLDGDANGFATENEDFSQDAIVGDAGDKFQPEIVLVEDPLNPADPHRVDIYGPVNLDLVFDNNLQPDGLPDVNRTFTIRGAIGDHPDLDVDFFRSGADVDVYAITLQAGQILRLGQMFGTADLTGRVLFNSNFVPVGSDQAISLATENFTLLDRTFRDEWLIKETGTFYIVVGNDFDALNQPGIVPDVPPLESRTGDYNFTVTVFDDGDTGFRAPTDSGNGYNLVNAPAPILFAGNNGVFQDPSDPNYDDRTVIFIGDFSFMLDPGQDGVRGTADDIVTGTNSRGVTSIRQGGTLTTTVNSAIGPQGHSGVPGDVAVDIDVFHLNNGQPIAAGTLMTIRVKLDDFGADLGSFSQQTFTDFRTEVQFGLFDTTSATDIDDALLIFSPTDFKPTGRAAEQIASRGPISYGYDANGDFYITFVTPERLDGTPGEAASLAVYLQGAFNTDYAIEVVTQTGAPLTQIPQTSQNVVIELNGGVIDWLEAGGLPTTLLPFDGAVLGLTGTVGGLPVNTYIVNNVLNRLTSIFQATGLNVNFATTPNAFEFQDFSTVFVTASNDPTTQSFTSNFGYSEHSDPFNTDKNDEGVVFLPNFATLGYTPSVADVNTLVDSLTAAIGRRVGELLGLRIEASDFDGGPEISIMAANSVFQVPDPGQVYRFSNEPRSLSFPNQIGSSGFYLGQQNAFALLDKFLTP